MIKVIDVNYNPIQHIGRVAGVCYGSDTENPEKNYKRGMECIEDNHGRIMEYADVTVEIDGYSNRMIRELYTTIIGVSRVQQSTRYVNMEKRYEEYFVPKTIEKNSDAKAIYDKAMRASREAYMTLLELGVPKEDAANLVPLGLHTTVVLKINLRAIVNLFEVRTCTRAYSEYRQFMMELKKELMGLDEEWKTICEKYLATRCVKAGYCVEKRNCGRYPSKKNVKIVEVE